MSDKGLVIITGAGSGIGRALAVGFSRDGFPVAGLGRTAASLEATQALCAEGRFLWATVDVCDERAVSDALARLMSTAGPAHALVCNAAAYPRDYFLDQPGEVWSQVIMTNLCGVANCCRAVLPTMLERNHGRIVIVSSLADRNPLPGSSAYSVSKGALHVLTRALAAEVDAGRYPGVLINEFNPSATRTAMSAEGEDPEAVYPRIRRLVDLPEGGPTGRMFWRDQEIRPSESLRARLRRIARRLVGAG